jgi:glutathione-regulated potassium-efflux system protein KefB
MAAEVEAIGASYLAQTAIFLAAAAVAAPLAKTLRIGSVLGYLAAGALIGPFGLGAALYSARDILHIAEFGVVLFLFLVGLELQPHRLWVMRQPVFGYGGAQVALTTAVFAVTGHLLGLPWMQALFIGFALSLSSTAFALQVLKETREITTQHGRRAFAVLLFQDIAAIPLIALVPLFAIGTAGAAGLADGMSLSGALQSIGLIVATVLIGIFGLNHVLRIVASTGLREAMTASALLVVVGVALLMQMAGLSPALGGFLAGVILSESAYRHEVEASIEPFGSLLLGLFFTAIGMSLDFRMLFADPATILGLAVAVVAIKALVLYGLGRAFGLSSPGARRLGLVCSQAGEFAFVLLASGVRETVLTESLADTISVVVTLSMAATPILMLLDATLLPAKAKTSSRVEVMPENQGHVIIAGFGRFGQIVARILRARGIPFTALDASSEQIDFVKQFGSKIYYGDASRLEILRAAQAEEARAFVLAIDDVEASLKTAEIVRHAFPTLPIYARARNRQHAYRLLDLGIQVVERETFLSALELSRELLRGLGIGETEARRLTQIFRAHDERRLQEDYRDASDLDKLRARARKSTEELEEMFRRDIEELTAEAARKSKDASARTS